MAYAILLASTAHACSCAMRTPEQHLQGADVAFVGEFQKIVWRVNPGDSEAAFKVIRVLKGEVKPEVTVRTGPICEIGWVNEKPGALWVVYAWQAATNSVPPASMLRTSSCSGTTSSTK